jgi:hypothetical protein
MGSSVMVSSLCIIVEDDLRPPAEKVPRNVIVVTEGISDMALFWARRNITADGQFEGTSI